MLQQQGVKMWADGSPFLGTLAASFPYLDSDVVQKAGIPIGPGEAANMNWTRQQIDPILEGFIGTGLQMATHINGDVALDIILDAYGRALATQGPLGTDHRWRIEHCGGARADQLQRAHAMGVVLSLSLYQVIYWGDLLDGQLFASDIGSQWARTGDAVRAGMRISLHFDGPLSPPIPLTNIQCAVTRMSLAGHVHGPEQIISLDQALRAHTIDAAYGLRREHEIGSLEAGKLADLVELSMDPYLADPTLSRSRPSILLPIPSTTLTSSPLTPADRTPADRAGHGWGRRDGWGRVLLGESAVAGRRPPGIGCVSDHGRLGRGLRSPSRAHRILHA